MILNLSLAIEVRREGEHGVGHERWGSWLAPKVVAFQSILKGKVVRYKFGVYYITLKMITSYSI